MATDGFDESKLYWLEDPDTGIIEPHRGVNNYIQQSYEAGVPISKNSNGEWYVTPYLEQTPTGLTAHVPEWFKSTQEYNTWANTYVPQINSMAVTQDNINSMSDILKSLGNMGFARMAYKQSARGMGITDESLLDQYVNTMQSIASEGAGQGDAQISGLFGSENTYTAAELARKYKEMSKEDLSAAVIKLEENLEAGKNGTFTGSQKELVDSLITLGLLQSVNANPTGYGDGEEFKGLMEASEWQKFQSWLASFSQSIMESFPILTWGFRLANGIGTAATGGDFLEGFAIENRRDTIYGAYTGLGLEGTEGSIVAGNITATAVSFAGTMAEAVLLGRVTGAVANGSSLLSSFSGTLGGGMVWDFVAHDIPMDLTLYARDLASGKSVDEAWYTEDETQPLFGLFGPEVPAGLAMNLVGDAIMDLGAPFISMAGGKVFKTVDNLTGGAVGRIRETVKIKNLAIQEKITQLPVIGTGIKKFSDFLWGAENANLVRNLRRTAIATGDISWYISAQNLLTLKNHAGAEVVAPLYKQLYESTGVMDMVEDFRKNAKDYGGIGDVNTKWSIAKGGTVKEVSETVVDQLPRQVKEGALIYERLGELKGQVVSEGEIIDNVKRNQEITRLERAYDAMPEKIKQFATKLSELNKQVEAIGVTLGLTTQDWIDALNADPRWTNYMTRQYVMPGGQMGAGALDPTANKLLTGKRTGFYDQSKVIDPIIALDLKVHAMGNAYAWNERAKVIAASELAMGKVATGGSSIEMAEKVKQIRGELMSADATRTKLGYDAVASGYNARVSGMTTAINDAAEAMHKLESLAAGSMPGKFNQLQSDFEAGKITFADGVKESAGLSDELAGSIIQNTYLDGAGIDANGVPYRYKIEDNQITSIKPITDAKGLAESARSMGREIPDNIVKRMDVDSVAAINKAQMFYRDNDLVIPGTKAAINYDVASRTSNGTARYSTTPTFVNGRMEMTQEISLSTQGYAKAGSDRDRFLAIRKSNAESRWHPANTTTLDCTPIHESAHTLTYDLVAAEWNKRIAAGDMDIKKLEANVIKDTGIFTDKTLTKTWTQFDLDFYKAKDKLAGEIVNGALSRMGEARVNKYLDDYSHYARDLKPRSSKNHEIIAESMLDYATNGTNANPLSKAIFAEMSERVASYQMEVNPRQAMQNAGLSLPKGMFGESPTYKFPDNVTTNTQKAEWLDGWRQKNPYLKGDWTDETFQKAQLWDNYFKSEINAYDSNVATSMPTKLMEKTGDYVTKTQQESITKIIDGIKKASGLEDFDSDLATMVLSHNAEDMQKAMENLIIRQVDQSAEALAKNMDGGLTPENLNTARVTLWSDLEMKESTTEMIRAWSPQAGVNTDELINNLFDTQAKGFAAYESLPVSTKSMQEEIETLRSQIRKENKRAVAVGKKMDARTDDKYGSYLDGGGHVIHYRDGGEDVYVVSTDPVIASVLQKPYNFKETGVTSQSLTAIANFNATLYRLGTTGINPMSIIRNVLRDPIQAIVTGGFNPISMSLDPTTFYKTLRQYGLDDNTIADVSSKIKNWANSSTLTQEMKIGNSYWQQSYRTKSEKFAKDLKKLTDTNVIEALQAPLESWESFFRNQIGQQSFVKNLERTGDVSKAMGLALFDTSNATTNFSHAIAGFKNITATVPYLSSAINGTASFWRLYNADPVGMISRLTAGFMVPVMAITAWNLSSEENRAIYETLPEWYREGHLVLVDPSGNVIAFPLPDEIQQFSGTARKLIEYTQEATPYSLPMIAAQGAFGFAPFEMDGFFTDSGEIDVGRGIGQLVDGIMPQAATTLYELIREEDLYTGADLSGYSTLNKVVNTLTNVFGTGFKQAINSIGVLCGVGDEIIGASYGETLARDLFGMGFDNAKNMFMEIVGTKASVDADGKVTKATGLFAEAEKLKDQIKTLDSKIAVTSGTEQAELEAQKQQLISDFTNRVVTLMDKYQTMFTVTGGLEAWQKNRLVQLLTLGDAFSSDTADSYSGQAASEAYLNERGLAIQRYVDAGLPAGPSGDFQNSLELQAAINKFYGNSKQATTDVTLALKNSNLKNIRSQFYDVISEIYDIADSTNSKPDYDLIEKIQARYLQAVDDALIPVLNTYGLNILSNNDFINEVRSYVNGMIPSDDWKQSTKNAKKYLSTKEFPTATVDVKKWLQQRYASSMRDRGIASDAEVTTKLQEIVNDINSGKQGAAKGKIESLRNGINKAQYYISSEDYTRLTQLYNMVK